MVCPIAKIIAPPVPIALYNSIQRFPSAHTAYNKAKNEVNAKVFAEICWNF